MFVICSPVGPYYPSGFKPQSLYGTTEYVRAAPGGNFITFTKVIHQFFLIRKGTGGYKVGANYAPGVVPQKEAAAKGYAQNLWLHDKDHYLTEA